MSPIDRMLGQTPKAVAFASTCFFLLAVFPAAAEEFTVNTIADSGDGSLRQEFADSNAGPDVVNTIVFETGAIDAGDEFLLPGGALPDLARTLTIDGTEPGGLELVGDGTDLLTINANGRLTLRDVAYRNGQILIEANGILTFDVTTDEIEITGLINDAPLSAGGTLTKTGPGSLILSGTNLFSGGITVSDGTLEVSTTTVERVSSIRTNAALRFAQPASGSYGGILLGSGSVEKTGAGTLTLTGDNTYLGGTTVSAGTLTGDPDSIQGDIAITSGATLEIVDDPGSLFDGTISGSGMFVKSGIGVLILDPTSGSNSWSNGQVSSGVLQGDAAAISGNVNILSGASLMIDQTGSGTLGGNLRGAGKFVKLGAGTLTLTGNNAGLTDASTDTISVTAGSLIGNTSSLSTHILTQTLTSLTFDQTVAGTYSDVISGDGNFIKTGTGTLTLSNAQTYAGTTTIRAGRLNVRMGLAGTSGTTIAQGATLTGVGTLNGAVINSGRIALGATAGTLSVGSIDFTAGSVLEVAVAPGAVVDRLVANNLGAVDLSNSTLELVLAPGVYDGETFMIFEAANGISALPIFSLDFPLLDIPPLAVISNILTLDINSGTDSFETIGQTDNQSAVGSAIDAEIASLSGNFDGLFQNFVTLQRPEFLAALDSLAGETLTQFATARFEHADRFDLALHSRLRAATDGLDRSMRRTRQKKSKTLPAVSAGALGATEPRIDVWLEPFVVFGGIDGDPGQSDVDYNLFGFTIGAETHPFPNASNTLHNIRLGAAFAYGRSELEFPDREGSGRADSYMGALYGGWSNDRFRVGLSGRLVYADMDSQRQILVGTINQDAEAEFDGLDLGTRLEVGGKWLNNDFVILESYGAIDYTHLQRASIQEKGAGALSLRIDREKLERLRVGFGTRLVTIIAIDRETWMLPELRAEWNHQLLDRDRAIDANFSGATTSPGFKIRGADLQRNSVSVGAGWTVRSRSGFEAAVHYDLGIDADRLAHAVALRVGTHW